MMLYMSPLAHCTMLAYARQCSAEVGGYGYVTLSEGDIYVSDIDIYKQIVTGTSVEVDTSDVAAVAECAAREGKYEQLRFSWHSHVAMKAYFSAVDTAYIDSVGASGVPWLISAVCNHAGDIVARADLWQPFRAIVPCEVTVRDTAVDAACAARVAECCVEPPPLPTVVRKGKKWRKWDTARVVSSRPAWDDPYDFADSAYGGVKGEEL